MQPVLASVRLSLVAVVTAALGGCFGVAHTWVHVPPLEVRVDPPEKTVAKDVTVDVVRAEFYGQPQALLALVTDAVEDKYPPYERHVLRTSPLGTSLLFGKEDRYVGMPLFVVGFPPSEETTRSLTVFFRVSSTEDVHRVEIRGNKATVQKTSVLTARANLPAILHGLRPTPPDPQWRTWFDAETKFYDGLKWQPSSELSVIDVQRTPERDVLVVKIGPA